MLKLVAAFAVSLTLGVISQQPKPCVTPFQLHFRMSYYNHAKDVSQKYVVSYDYFHERQVWFQQRNVTVPGKQFFEYLRLNNERVFYTINLDTKECTKSVPGPFKPIGVRANATFEDEYYIGGPNEEVYETEWSNRVSEKRREDWIGSFTLKNCYPVRIVYISNDNITATATIYYYDIVEGIPNPDDFIPPKECETAEWADPFEDCPWMFHDEQ